MKKGSGRAAAAPFGGDLAWGLGAAGVARAGEGFADVGMILHQPLGDSGGLAADLGMGVGQGPRHDLGGRGAEAFQGPEGLGSGLRPWAWDEVSATDRAE